MKSTFQTCALSQLFKITRKVVVPSSRPTATFYHYSIPAWDELGGPCRESGSDIGSAKLQISSPGILVSKLNPRIPRVILVHPQPDQNCCASTEFIYYTPCDSTVNLRFYYHYFASRLFQRRLEAIAIGSTNSQTRAKPSETLSWQIPHPHPSEQRRIAEILDAIVSQIKTEQMNLDKLVNLKSGLTDDLLAGKVSVGTSS
jgi:type I restriction enzyme S subunit